jgi:hypothetical protein
VDLGGPWVEGPRPRTEFSFESTARGAPAQAAPSSVPLCRPSCIVLGGVTARAAAQPRPMTIGRESDIFILDFFGDKDARSQAWFRMPESHYLSAFPSRARFLGFFFADEHPRPSPEMLVPGRPIPSLPVFFMLSWNNTSSSSWTP